MAYPERCTVPKENQNSKGEYKMNRLICEICGSTDLIKQDGVFVCQACRCKYSIEEARKMMVEGTVEIVGTVKIDNSGHYDKFIGLARDAFEDSRYESSFDYSSKH